MPDRTDAGIHASSAAGSAPGKAGPPAPAQEASADVGMLEDSHGGAEAGGGSSEPPEPAPATRQPPTGSLAARKVCR